MNTPPIIQSPHNPRVKLWYQLLEKKGRDQQNLYMIEGAKLIYEALKSGADICTIVYLAGTRLPSEINELIHPEIEIIAVSDVILHKCMESQTPQPLFAIVHKPLLAKLEPFLHLGQLYIALDGIQDPGNMGTIIRSADAAGAAAVLVGHGSVDLYNPKTVRSTMGSIFHLPVIECDLKHVLPLLKIKSIPIYSASLQAKVSCYQMDWRKGGCFIVGNEAKGVSVDISSIVDLNFTIPMEGKAESLNAAMAATVILFEALRQRRL